MAPAAGRSAHQIFFFCLSAETETESHCRRPCSGEPSNFGVEYGFDWLWRALASVKHHSPATSQVELGILLDYSLSMFTTGGSASFGFTLPCCWLEARWHDEESPKVAWCVCMVTMSNTWLRDSIGLRPFFSAVDSDEEGPALCSKPNPSSRNA